MISPFSAPRSIDLSSKFLGMTSPSMFTSTVSFTIGTGCRTTSVICLYSSPPTSGPRGCQVVLSRNGRDNDPPDSWSWLLKMAAPTMSVSSLSQQLLSFSSYFSVIAAFCSSFLLKNGRHTFILSTLFPNTLSFPFCIRFSAFISGYSIFLLTPPFSGQESDKTSTVALWRIFFYSEKKPTGKKNQKPLPLTTPTHWTVKPALLFTRTKE